MVDKTLTPEEIAANLAQVQHIKSWLRHRRTTQSRLASMMDVSEPTVSKWLKGTQSMTVAQFSRIAHLVDVSPGELLSAPADALKSKRYQSIADVAKNIPDVDLDAWLQVGRALSKK